MIIFSLLKMRLDTRLHSYPAGGGGGWQLGYIVVISAYKIILFYFFWRGGGGMEGPNCKEVRNSYSSDD